MLEYVLFAEPMRQRFIDWLEAHDIACQSAGEGEELLVLVAEDLDETTQDRIEEQYDCLLAESALLADQQDDSPDAVHRVGIQFRYRNGEHGLVRISPQLANRLHRCLDMVELQAFVQMIADAVENPDDRPLCKP